MIIRILNNTKLKENTSTGFLVIFNHLADPLATLSTIYPIIGDPPSLSGQFQISLHELALTSNTSGLDGGLGTSDY